MVAGQRVADQHRVAAVGVERAVGLVGDLERRKLDAGVELQRPVDARHERIARRIGLAAARNRFQVLVPTSAIAYPGGQRLALQRVGRDRAALMSMFSLI